MTEVDTRGYSQGAVTPGRVVDTAKSVSLHNFAGVVRNLVLNAHAAQFPTEDSKLAALRAIEVWEKETAGKDHYRHEDDPAPIEDVSLRKAPNAGAFVVPPPAGGIDYDRLAHAILAAQEARRQQNEVTSGDSGDTSSD